MPLDNKCRIGPLAGAPPISTETESDSSLKMTRLQSVTLCPRSAKIQSTLMMWGQCDVVGAEVATLLIARSRSFVFLGRPDPPRRYTLIHFANTEQLPYPTEGAAERLGFLRPIIRPLSKSVSCSYYRRLCLREKSQYRLSKSSDSFG
ncbi:hypothetical protein TNCV_3088471 [Trichonephila clavipes]|uniref:Uncharacterized protein n=1 Tax=Trichonephila clavipes TaxID=2585209 RepID=A0A8X6V0G4_TRICX|nr:hypothetical protein TNCV_3088471 [Trichonephila clavipes]